MVGFWIGFGYLRVFVWLVRFVEDWEFLIGIVRWEEWGYICMEGFFFLCLW